MSIHLSSKSFPIRFQEKLDYVPVVSTVSNISILFQKTICFFKQNEVVNKSLYWSWIKDRSAFRSLILLIPFVGNIFVAIYDLGRSQALNQAIIQTKKSDDDLIKDYKDKHGPVFMLHCTDEEKENENFVGKAILVNPENLQFASLKIKQSANFFIAAITKTLDNNHARPYCICKYIDESLHQNIPFFKELVAKDGRCFEYFPDHLKADWSILHLALANYSGAIKSFKGTISKEWIMSQAGLTYQPAIYPYLDPHLQQDEEIQNVLTKKEEYLYLLPPSFKNFEDTFIKEYVEKLEIEDLTLLMKDERLERNFDILSNKKIMKAAISRSLHFIDLCNAALANDNPFMIDCEKLFLENFNANHPNLSLCLKQENTSPGRSIQSELPSSNQQIPEKNRKSRRLSAEYMKQRQEISVEQTQSKQKSSQQITSPPVKNARQPLPTIIQSPTALNQSGITNVTRPSRSENLGFGSSQRRPLCNRSKNVK
ncbi:MAG: hypothetical protein ACOVOR_04170 [Rhabdochlamydiaceae bacterium]